MQLARTITSVALLLSVLVFAGCKTIQQPWAWVDEPENQVWMPVAIELLGRTVTFSVPDSDSRMGTNTIRVLDPGVEERDGRIVVPLETTFARISGFVVFYWERYWGGYFESDTNNYKLTIRLDYLGENSFLLDMTPTERQQKIVNDYRRRSAGTKLGDWNISRFTVDLYQSSQGYVWTNQNFPARIQSFEEFKIPISDHHQLRFDFYYRMDVDEGEGNTQDWYERRQALSRRILDTVKISPEPLLPSD